MDIERIKSRIREIALSPRNVRFSELVRLLDGHIGPLYPGYNHHGSPHHAFTVGGRTFTVAEPKRGCVKKPYVDQFLDVMEELGLFDPEEDP